MASGDKRSPCYHAPRTLTSEKLSASGDATAVTSSHSRRLLLTGRFSATVARRKTPWCGGQPEHLVSFSRRRDKSTYVWREAELTRIGLTTGCVGVDLGLLLTVYLVTVSDPDRMAG